MYSHETDVPPQQKEKSAQARLPQAYEDRFRQGDNQPPPQKGKKTPLCLTRRSFPKSLRILKRSHYKKVVKGRSKWSGKFLFIVYRLGHASCPKLGLTVTRRFGKAHDRNRFKRLVREAFRHLYPNIPTDLEMNVFPRSKPERLSMVSYDLKRFLSTLSKR